MVKNVWILEENEALVRLRLTWCVRQICTKYFERADIYRRKNLKFFVGNESDKSAHVDHFIASNYKNALTFFRTDDAFAREISERWQHH